MISTIDLYTIIGLFFVAVLFLLPATVVLKKDITKKNTIVFGVDLAQMPKDLKVTQKIQWIRSQNRDLTSSQATSMLAQWEGINQPK